MKYDAEAMKAACKREAPREACGLVFPNGLTLEIDNIRYNGGIFAMDQGQFDMAVEQHGMFVAIWHTHPRGDIVPSPFDQEFHMRHYEDMGVVMIIATETEVAEYAHGY